MVILIMRQSYVFSWLVNYLKRLLFKPSKRLALLP